LGAFLEQELAKDIGALRCGEPTTSVVTGVSRHAASVADPLFGPTRQGRHELVRHRRDRVALLARAR